MERGLCVVPLPVSMSSLAVSKSLRSTPLPAGEGWNGGMTSIGQDFSLAQTLSRWERDFDSARQFQSRAGGMRFRALFGSGRMLLR